MLNAEYITRPETVVKYRDEILAAPVLGVDTETTGLDPLSSELRLLQIATSPERAFIFDLRSINPQQPELQFIRDLFADPQKVKIFQNAKFDVKFLRRHLSVAQFESIYDTYLAGVLINCGDDSVRNDLATLAAYYAGIELDKREQKSNFGNLQLTESQLRYAAIDAAVLFAVRDGQNKYLRALDLERVARLEFNCVEAVACLELHGIYLDAGAWTERVERQKLQLVELREKLVEHFRSVSQVSMFGDVGIDPESPQQVLEGLKKLGVPVDSTTQESKIKALAHKYPVIQDLFDYREISTALKMFGPEYLKFIHPATGRIHAEFKQIGTPTGRFTCNNPNLQQVPSDSAYRNCFRAQGENRTLVIADYSQIELRIMAELSRDPRLLEVFNTGQDLHYYTAAHLKDKPIDQVSKAERQIGKMANFATAYGTQAKRFSLITGLPVSEAEQVLKKFWRVYSGLDEYMKSCERRAVSELESHSFSGRTWRFDCDPNDYQSVGQVERLGRNFPVQATCSDILKRALYLLRNRLRGTGSFVVNAVHDELVAECDAVAAEDTEQQMHEAMSEAAAEVLTVVKPEIDSKISEVWTKE